MIDYSSKLLLINVFIWMLMFFVCSPVLRKHKVQFIKTENKPLSNSLFPKYRISSINKRYIIFCVLFYLYCVFAFADHDTYHMWSSFVFDDYLYHVEPFYRWLADYLNYNYFLWRAIVWGIACCSLFCLVRLLNLQSNTTILMFILILPVTYFCATRGSSGHSLALLSTMLLLGRNELYRKNYLFGVCGLFLSFFLHRSNLTFILMLLFSVFFPIKFNKKTIMISLIIFPLLVNIITLFLTGFINGDFEIEIGEDMNMQNKAQSYASRDAFEFNIFGIMTNIMRKLPSLYAMYYLTDKIVFKKVHIESAYLYLYKMSYVITYVAFLFVFQNTSTWLHERFLFMANIPMTFVLARLITFNNGWLTGGRFFVLLSLLNVFYVFAYRYYLWP